MQQLSFKFGEVLDPDDELAVWMANLAIAFNDLILTHMKMDVAGSAWERFYYWRLGIGHYHEVMAFVAARESHPRIASFISDGGPDLERAHREALDAHAATKVVVAQVRNGTIFHYPSRKGLKALRRAMRDTRDEQVGITSSSGKLRDTRVHFADELMARMVMNASGGDKSDNLALVWGELADAVMKFIRFTNAALDTFFLQHRDRLQFD